MGTSCTQCLDYIYESNTELNQNVNNNRKKVSFHQENQGNNIHHHFNNNGGGLFGLFDNSDKNPKSILKESSPRNKINNHGNNINNNFQMLPLFLITTIKISKITP